MSNWFCLPSEKGSTRKGKNLFPLFPFIIDLFLEALKGFGVQRFKQEVAKVVSLAKHGGKIYRVCPVSISVHIDQA